MRDKMHINTQTKCYHCGDVCENEHWKSEDKLFCCNGCKTVYELLSENQLSQYYEIEDKPGLKRNQTNGEEKFAYLDNPELKSKIIRFSNEETSLVVFRIPSIHCTSCIWLLENLHKLSAGVKSVRVNFTSKQANITFNEEEVSLRALVELLSKIGYDPEITDEQLGENQSNKLVNRSLYYKIGLAGFCFGNIMLLSFPEYLGLKDIGGYAFKQLFGYLNFALALPVFLYCAQDYYKSAWTGLKQKMLNLDLPISLGIISLFTRSTYEIFSVTGTGYMDSLAGLLFFMLIGKWFQSKSYDQLSFERDYKSYFPLATNKLIGNKTTSIPIEKIEEGDHLKIFHEELIPADAYLLSDSAAIDYSFVSGESEPVKISAGEKIFAGGRLKSTAVNVEVINKVSQSYLTSLWNNISNFNKAEKTLSDHFSHYFTPVILLIAFVAGIYWVNVAGWGTATLIFTSVLIVACPCAIALSSPFTLGNAMRILGRNKFYLKNTNVIERMAKINHIVFDKTGTLSLNKAASILYVGNDLDGEEQHILAKLLAQSSHPVSRIIFKYLNVHLPKENKGVVDFQEVKGGGVQATVYGREVKLGSPSFVGIDPSDARFGGTYLSIDGNLYGCFILSYEYRKGIESLVGRLKSKFKLSLLSGDHDTEQTYLEEFFGTGENMHFRQSPHDKQDFIKLAQSQGDSVLMIGDGLNDSGALMQSNVGVAVADDVNNFSPACDAIIDGKSMNKLDTYINYAKGSLNLVKAAFGISLMYNSIGLLFAITGMLSPIVAAILMPLSSVTIVSFGIASTWILARKYNISREENIDSRKNEDQL